MVFSVGLEAVHKKKKSGSSPLSLLDYKWSKLKSVLNLIFCNQISTFAWFTFVNIYRLINTRFISSQLNEIVVVEINKKNSYSNFVFHNQFNNRMSDLLKSWRAPLLLNTNTLNKTKVLLFVTFFTSKLFHVAIFLLGF